MNYKQLISIGVIVIGLVLLGFGIYGSNEMAKARGDIDTVTGIVPKNPFTGTVKKGLHGKVDEYILPVTLCYIGGVLCIALGGISFYLFRRK